LQDKKNDFDLYILDGNANEKGQQQAANLREDARGINLWSWPLPARRVPAHGKLRQEGENGEGVEEVSGGAHRRRRAPMLVEIWPETRWPAAAPWTAVSSDVGATKST